MKTAPVPGYFTAAFAAWAKRVYRGTIKRPSPFASSGRLRTRTEPILAVEPLEPRVVLSTFTVTTANDSGSGSLRNAIQRANATSEADLIQFNIPGGGVQTIALLSPLPPVKASTTIAGNSQPGFSGTPLIELDGNAAGPATNGLLLTGAGSIVRGLAINDFTGNGIAIRGSNVVVEGCFIGTDETGSVAESNDLNGIAIFGAATNVRIGGASNAAKNVISGNADAGVTIIGSLAKARVLGNFIGTNAAGTAALGNEIGVLISDGSRANIIGGTVAKARNVISGNIEVGVDITGDGSDRNTVLGNFIGTNAAGAGAVPNVGGGVLVRDGASFNFIGKAVLGGKNVISGNTGAALKISDADTTHNKVQGNFIGTNAAGTAALANNNGILIAAGSTENLIGGTTALARNIISGNTSRGVEISGSGSNDNRVFGNYIGTNAAGDAAIPNNTGVIIFATSNNKVGAAKAGAGNVISGNTSNGVSVLDTGNFHTTIQGNIIGLNAGGNAALPNDRGIGVAQGAGNVIIGGTSPLARNIISGNTDFGISIITTNGANCVVQGNYIGTLKDGRTPAGNGIHGIAIAISAHDNVIGGTEKGAGNLIAHNGGDGVLIGSDSTNGLNDEAGNGNTVIGNRIFSNGGQGIDLGPNDGPTANDLNDSDSGANTLLNKPVITAAVLSGNVVLVTGTVRGFGNQVLQVEFFANRSGGNEGQFRLGVFGITVTSGSNTPFGRLITLPSGLGIGDIIMATVTDTNGNTSEFSVAIAIA